MHRSNWRRLWRVCPTVVNYGGLVRVTLACALAVVAGCTGGSKPGAAHLQGAITIDGQPPPSDALGTISFRATTTGQAHSTSAQILNGKYDCENVPLGKITVFLQLVQQTGKMVNDGGRQYPELHNLVPSKYNNGIELEITDDNTSQDFDLVSK
jgi:hypothetical protein